MDEPDYRSFTNKSQEGNTYRDDREKQLQAELAEYRENHPKPWYLKTGGQLSYQNKKRE